MKWVSQNIPEGYTAKMLNAGGSIPAWKYLGDLSYSIKRHYRGIPYRLELRGNFEDGFYLDFFYWWNNRWMKYCGSITSGTFPQIINDLFDSLIGTKCRFVWS